MLLTYFDIKLESDTLSNQMQQNHISLVALPEQIFKLPAIEDVDASDNKIFAWPKKLDKLQKKASVNTNGMLTLLY